jgi:hypothetical protein
LINLFSFPSNLSYDAVVETLSTIIDTSLPKSPSESVQFPLSRIQRKRCTFVNQLLAEAMMEIVEESEVHILAQQQLIGDVSGSIAKKKELAQMLMGIIRTEVADCEVVDH